ncbi:MAG TPA: MotA/TolQ/ExbB proton channel family protein [Myxococcota bacterium]|nr:MotA/TolQ/ExbB proton channel family protein [Myxococcota bacterium]
MEHGLLESIAALRVGGAMVYPLLALAVLATAIFLDKCFVYWRRTRVPGVVVDTVESFGFDWAELEQQLGALEPRNFLVRFFGVILANRRRPAWWVESRASDEARLIEQSLARWLWVLETIVTAAPLLGLLGTITGMIRSFHLFGDQGLVDPRGVTGGVAEALIATAVGLFIALAALFAFNFVSQWQTRFMDQMERFGTRLVDHIRLDEQGHNHADS